MDVGAAVVTGRDLRDMRVPGTFSWQPMWLAFALDIGFGALIAGNLLALMGVMGLLGVLVSGFLADRIGPARPTLLCFAMRIGIFVLVILSQSKPAVMMFALLYGFTFLMTAPLTVDLLGEHLWVGAAGGGSAERYR